MEKVKKYFQTKTQIFRFDTETISDINKIDNQEFFIQIQIRAFFNQLFNGNDAKCFSCSQTVGNIIDPNTIQIQSKRFNYCNCALLAQKNNYVVCPKCSLGFFTLKESDVICPLCKIQFCRLCRKFQQLYLSCAEIKCNCYRSNKVKSILLFIMIVFLQLTFGIYFHIIERYKQLRRKLRLLYNWYLHQEHIQLIDWLALPINTVLIIFWYVITIIPTHISKSFRVIIEVYQDKIA
ncbi:hypothetical protein pb186bvf_003533 [Paramecium bursaria]